MDAVSAELEAVVIFDENLYRPGGQVSRWMNLLCEHFEQHAVRNAPQRTGELRAGIMSEAHPFGARQMQGTIASLAPYSLYVLRGTGYPVRGRAGRIYNTRAFNSGRDIENAMVYVWGYRDPVTKRFSRTKIPGVPRKRHRLRRKGYWLAFGPDDHGPRVITFSVSGQEANNFLFAAWRATARTHSSLRGLAPNAAITEFG